MGVQQTDQFFAVKGIKLQESYYDFADDVKLLDVYEAKLSDLIFRQHNGVIGDALCD